MADFSKGSNEWNFFQDYWKFRQNYYEAENDEWFAILIQQSREFCKKYENTEMAEYVEDMIIDHQRDVKRRFYAWQDTTY